MNAQSRDLSTLVQDVSSRHPVPGCAVGVWQDGRTETVFTGVTSVDNPLPVDERTLCQVGSISKIITATMIMHLDTLGRLDLDRPVRTYLPGLRLQDEDVAASITVRHLLNHTAGWDGTMTSGGDEPDAPLERFVTDTLPRLDQLSRPGRRPEYNNAAVALAGRVVEQITGRPFEEAVRTRLLEPLRLTDTHFSTEDLITERVSVGHTLGDHGRYDVARPWRWPRAANPEGGLVATIGDVLGWARFHLGDGRDADGRVLLGREQLRAMRTPTARLVGNVMGDAIGLGWFLRTVAGESTLGHQGTTNGQFAELRLVPARNYAVVVHANGGPAGTQFTREIIDGALELHLGLEEPERPVRPHDPSRHGDVSGRYRNNLADLTVTVDGGTVILAYSVRPEMAASLGDPVFPPCRAGFLSDRQGEYVVVDGPFEGTTGSFARDSEGRVTEIDFGGRWHRRLS